MQPNTSKHHYASRPETIEETAELVSAAGGTGIAVRVDHTVDAEVAALFPAHRARNRSVLDVLVNISRDSRWPRGAPSGSCRSMMAARSWTLDLAPRGYLVARGAAHGEAQIGIGGRDRRAGWHRPSRTFFST